jgi:hypothetical protein
MSFRLLSRLKRVVSQPPEVLLRRVQKEMRIELGRFLEPRREARFDERALQRATQSPSLESLWETLSETDYVARSLSESAELLDQLPDSDRTKIMKAADQALSHRVDLLGSGPLLLGESIDWHCDLKSGHRWPMSYGQRMEYVDLGKAREVKFPWELSRVQWLIPVAQAFHLTKEERYAAFIRDILRSWIDRNPFALGVNWASTMEVSIRLITWTFLFHTCKQSHSWTDREFRFKFLKTLYLHGEFTEKYLEESDINGNHLTANAAGLVFAGLFFRRGESPDRWATLGWELLTRELPLQVGSDGVDIESSMAYHRLVLELFLLPAVYRKARGMMVDPGYRDQLIRMAEFTACSIRPNGSVPLWGDADDGRALPLGTQGINDHRYLPGLVGVSFDHAGLIGECKGEVGELVWLLGGAAGQRLNDGRYPAPKPSSCSFPVAGVYILRNESDHVFIDCGPVGFMGRGGHGHNDCLSFEAALDGVLLASDSGTFVYTGSFELRNLFRSTSSHNTPQVDGEELNRWISKENLWRLRDDARPEVILWAPGERDVFCGKHTGYQRLPRPVTPHRSICLEHTRHRLMICDSFSGEGEHSIAVPLHFAPEVEAVSSGEDQIALRAEGKSFVLTWKAPPGWRATIVESRVSPRYGVLQKSLAVQWAYQGGTPTWLSYGICSAESEQTSFNDWHEMNRRDHEERVRTSR